MNGTRLPNWKRLISGAHVFLIILGGPAYPALPCLMKPYPETPQTTAEQRRYNYLLEIKCLLLAERMLEMSPGMH